MNKKSDFIKYNMRDDFEFQVYLYNINIEDSDKYDFNNIKNESDKICGVLIKKDNLIILKLSDNLKNNINSDNTIWTELNNVVKNQDDKEILLLSTWDNKL